MPVHHQSASTNVDSLQPSLGQTVTNPSRPRKGSTARKVSSLYSNPLIPMIRHPRGSSDHCVPIARTRPGASLTSISFRTSRCARNTPILDVARSRKGGSTSTTRYFRRCPSRPNGAKELCWRRRTKREVSRSILSRYLLQVGDGGRGRAGQERIIRAQLLMVIGKTIVRSLCDEIIRNVQKESLPHFGVSKSCLRMRALSWKCHGPTDFYPMRPAQYNSPIKGVTFPPR